MTSCFASYLRQPIVKLAMAQVVQLGSKFKKSVLQNNKKDEWKYSFGFIYFFFESYAATYWRFGVTTYLFLYACGWHVLLRWTSTTSSCGVQTKCTWYFHQDKKLMLPRYVHQCSSKKKGDKQTNKKIIQNWFYLGMFISVAARREGRM